jgi:hypothetical protein
VAKGMPHKDYNIVTKELVDSLYYSFSPYFKGKINDSLYGKSEAYKHRHEEEYHDNILVKGINPAIIKTIKDEQFQNTLLATREFEIRLQAIFNLCNNKAIEIYINNLDKNL